MFKFKKIKSYLLIALLTLVTPLFAHQKEIALTIDDLPFVGESKNFHLNMIIEALKAQAVPATGFIIGQEVNNQNIETLRKFREAGLSLGNHTLSHANLNKMSADAFIQEIDVADKILSPVMTQPKYFRYPYLIMGNGDKKDKILQYLYAKNYQIAPVTIDSKDFMFNQLLLNVPEAHRRDFLSSLKTCYLDFLWQETLQAMARSQSQHKIDQTQVLLIHANLLNAYVLPDIINLYKQNGFTFVSLDAALKSKEATPAPQSLFASKTQHWKEPLMNDFVAWD